MAMQRTAMQRCSSQALPGRACAQQLHYIQTSAATTPSALRDQHSRRNTVTCVARRTKSGGGERDRKVSSSTSTKSSSGNSSQFTGNKPSSSSSSSGPSPTRQRGKQQGISELESFIRKTPVANRFLDGLLILGDAVMLLATEMSSERLPLEQVPALASVAVISWVAAGAVLGDYAMLRDPDENPLSNAMGWPIFQAVVNAMITWAVAMVFSIGGFSWLVSSYVVEPELVLEVARDGMLSPQLEISVAMLITMSCWRGMAARLRL
ncbi:hypothetical protein COO60DRAFT_1706334 [Scenedesmus sp. NREL 46B-D3]|nr:hypothetical protein COO60DRAFT_1706334 [Scenedesmus sp. NREL 46B-D3]